MKMKDFGFWRGVDLGGWFSQCDYSEDRLEHFITEKDLDRIASWGLDHVRIPIDYNVVEDDNGVFIPDGFRRIGRAIGWCRERNLKVVLDLHKTAGFSFDAGEAESGFFDSEKYQERFYCLWEELARRFYDPENVAFELLNEVTDAAFIDAWNRISQACIRRIRPIAPKALILIGSYHNNSADAVKALAAPADDRVVYNFHCYDPLVFTHQGAPWVPDMPVDFRQSFEAAAIPADYFEKAFASAIEAAEKNNTALYCGEYGVIDRATPEDAVKWYRMIHDTFEKHQISRAAWSYKEMDFGLSDGRMDGVRDELLSLL